MTLWLFKSSFWHRFASTLLYHLCSHIEHNHRQDASSNHRDRHRHKCKHFNNSRARRDWRSDARGVGSVVAIRHTCDKPRARQSRERGVWSPLSRSWTRRRRSTWWQRPVYATRLLQIRRSLVPRGCGWTRRCAHPTAWRYRHPMTWSRSGCSIAGRLQPTGACLVL